MNDDMTHDDKQLAKATVLFIAVQALISTHPDPAKLRSTFNQLLGGRLANFLVSGAADPVATEYMKKFADALFQGEANH